MRRKVAIPHVDNTLDERCYDRLGNGPTGKINVLEFGPSRMDLEMSRLGVVTRLG